MFGRRRNDSGESSGGERLRRDKGERRRDREEEDREALAGFFRAFGRIALDQASYFADRYRHKAAGAVDVFAETLRNKGARQHHGDARTGFAEDIADDLEDLSDAIRELRLSSALDEIGNMARRKPLAFGLGAMAAGYVIARLTTRSSKRANARSRDAGRG